MRIRTPFDDMVPTLWSKSALLCVIAAGAALVFLSAVAPDETSAGGPPDDSSLRRLAWFNDVHVAGDPKTVDRKTVVVRVPEDIPQDILAADDSAASAAVASIAPGDFFPYHVREGRCVQPAQVLQEARAIRDLNALGVRVFPRNGFLLGVIRHGGYLPHETPDADLAFVYEDVARLGLAGEGPAVASDGDDGEGGRRNLRVKRDRGIPLGDFRVKAGGCPADTWVNWKGLNPATGEKYPFCSTTWVRHGRTWRGAASPVFPWRDSRTFYPWATVAGYNHEHSLNESLRWNTEGANVRLLETDELATWENYAPGKQMGYVFPKIDCMVEKQFYFTTISVPCDYEAILQAQYGPHWNRVEPRPSRTDHESKVISEEESNMWLENGPYPLCSS